MSDPKKPQKSAPERSAEARPAEAAGESAKRSGRVALDARGNTVWEWQLETGVYTRDISTQKLKKLDLGELSIADTAIQKQPPDLADASKPNLPGGGFNPYDNAPPKSGGFNPYDNARAMGNKLADQPKPAAPARKPSDMRKLDAWVKLVKRIGKDRDE